jgi:inner membrane protein
MASAFSHTIIALTIGKSFEPSLHTKKIFWLGSICAVIPDLDVLAFNFGIPYEHALGHRGFFHSAFFCALLAFLLASIISKKREFGKLFLFFFLCGLSHGLFDMLTNGGLGVAIFAPFDNQRYFFPFCPIEVSPIGLSKFLSERGLRVISSELLWIGLPCVLWLAFLKFLKKNNVSS